MEFGSIFLREPRLPPKTPLKPPLKTPRPDGMNQLHTVDGCSRRSPARSHTETRHIRRRLALSPAVFKPYARRKALSPAPIKIRRFVFHYTEVWVHVCEGTPRYLPTPVHHNKRTSHSLSDISHTHWRWYPQPMLPACGVTLLIPYRGGHAVNHQAPAMSKLCCTGACSPAAPCDSARAGGGALPVIMSIIRSSAKPRLPQLQPLIISSKNKKKKIGPVDGPGCRSLVIGRTPINP